MQLSIIEFSLENYKIFKNKTTFSMLARKNDNHTFTTNDENFLRTSLIYGPNASGKTTFFDAIYIFKTIILLSANISEKSELPYRPFLASTNSVSKPTFFEIVFSISGSAPFKGIYRYNFSFNKEEVLSEKLSTILNSGEEKNLFLRNKQSISLGNFFEDAEFLVERTRKEALFLSVTGQFNIEFADKLLNLLKNINVTSGVNSSKYTDFTIKKFKESNSFKEKILQYLKKADFCISEGRVEERDVQTLDISDANSEFSITKRTEKNDFLILKHPVFDKENNVISHFELSFKEESAGTKKFLSVLGPIIDTLENGKILLIDEFDNSLHPLLTKLIIDLFESSSTNKKNAQLIVTTHDTNLLSYKEDFIRDQFWFTDKDDFGVAKLYSLAEFQLRNDTEYAKKYLEGRFGALPFINFVRN